MKGFPAWPGKVSMNSDSSISICFGDNPSYLPIFFKQCVICLVFERCMIASFSLEPDVQYIVL